MTDIPSQSQEELLERIRELEEKLAESEETLQALRSGEVDAIVASGPEGEQIYTLKGADETYRQIVEEMTEGALTLGNDGLVLFSNERFARLVGVPLEQVIGARLQGFIAAEDANVVAALGSPDLQDGKAEVRLRSQGGGAVPAYLSWKRAKQDELECICVIVTDLSEQKRNEETVSAEKLARSILEQAADAMLVVDLEGRIVRASRACDRLAGVSVLMRNVDEVFVLFPAAEPMTFSFREILTKVKQGSSVERMETTAILPGARNVQLLLSAAPLASTTGELLGCILSLIDITERRRAEQALRESETRLRNAIDLAEMAPYTWNPATRALDWHRRLKAMWGLPPEAHVDYGVFFGAVHPDDRQAVAEAVARCVDPRGDGRYSAECRVIGIGDGVERWVVANGQTLFDRGKAVSFFGTALDITERKRAEQSLLQAAEELRASNMALTRSNEDLERFAFIASHDLQEPLRMITAYSQLLVKEYPGSGKKNPVMYIGNIVDGTRRMRELIADLLTYTEIRGAVEEPTETVDLNRVLETVKLNLKFSIDDSRAVITCGPLPLIRAHESHAIALFQNLIGNAIKYRAAEPPEIQINFWEAEGELRFAVRDNGIGIEPEYHETIFVAFKRLHAKKIPGSGIGLAICQRVVERYGGRIWVESEAGRGATFHFALPDSAVRPPADGG